MDAWRDVEASPIDYVCRLHGKPWVLGKGHASIVLAGYIRGYGVVAVKVRRTDSKRESLSREAFWASRASLAGAGPRIHYWSNNVIVMDLVTGHSLRDLVEQGSLQPTHIIAALGAARALDAVDVLHHELSRPWRHVYITGLHAIIIDYDSAGEGCGNVPKLLSGILHRVPGGLEILRRLRPLLAEYRRGGCPLETYETIKDMLEDLLRSDLAGGDGETLGEVV